MALSADGAALDVALPPPLTCLRPVLSSRPPDLARFGSTVNASSWGRRSLGPFDSILSLEQVIVRTRGFRVLPQSLKSGRCFC